MKEFTPSVRIREAIEKSGMSYAELEKKSGISKSALQRYASGITKKIPIDVVEKVAPLLGVTSAYLMGWEERPAEDYTKIPGILPLPEMVDLPIIGTIACGVPILAEENIEGYLSAPKRPSADFCLRCKGDSMINARILDGDVVLIRKQPDVDDGQIAAVLIDDEATLKRVYHTKDGGVMLVAENPAYPPMTFTAGDCIEIRILGKAVAFVSSVK